MSGIQLLKTIVGSHAHGLSTAQSDKDFRSVYITPTSDLLKVAGPYKGTSWIEGESDLGIRK